MSLTSCGVIDLMTRFMGLASVVLFLIATAVRGEEPLSVRIDRLILEKAAGQTPAERCDDFTFARRAYLDFAGRIPSPEETARFQADAATDKRTKLVDALLASPEYARRMAESFHVSLMERRGDEPDWQTYLSDSFAANKPWDVLVREVLKPNPDDEATRASAFFLTKRLEAYGQNPVDYPGLVRDVGRLFFGRDLQCAQCHDHLFIDDYKQVDFQGLYAFFHNLSIRGDVKFPALKEKPLEKKVEFVSVFEGIPHATGPRVPGGIEVAWPPSEADATAKRLAILAAELPVGGDSYFGRNAANRIWFSLMGRGVVHPLDQHHSGNPPSHPELLTLLAGEFAAHKYDLKWLLRELAMTETYQRSGIVPDEANAPEVNTFLVALERRLSAEQLALSVLQATGQRAALAEPADEVSVARFKEMRDAFVAAFANPAREPEEEFVASVKASLYLLNDEKFLALLAPQPGNLVERATQMSDVSAKCDELYLSVLSRLPTEEERADASVWLKANETTPEIGVRHLAWALLSSTEFLVNH